VTRHNVSALANYILYETLVSVGSPNLLGEIVHLRRILRIMPYIAALGWVDVGRPESGNTMQATASTHKRLRYYPINMERNGSPPRSALTNNSSNRF
jgi:hypothetical protein